MTSTATTTDAPLVRVTGLYKFHGPSNDESTGLREVSFEVEAGRFVCIMGPSGSGKSTLLHLISGLDEASAGSVELAGKNTAGLSARQRTLLRRKTVGYVFQFFNLLPNLTLRENVALPLAIAGQRSSADSAGVEALIARFDLEKRADALPHQLSGGEMQRTSIARALAGGQPLLLCDEPTGNLSQKAGAEVMEMLREVVDNDDRTVLLVTHNPRDAAYADEVRFLVDGKIVEEHTLHGPNLTVDAVHEALKSLSI